MWLQMFIRLDHIKQLGSELKESFRFLFEESPSVFENSPWAHCAIIEIRREKHVLKECY